MDLMCQQGLQHVAPEGKSRIKRRAPLFNLAVTDRCHKRQQVGYKFPFLFIRRVGSPCVDEIGTDAQVFTVAVGFKPSWQRKGAKTKRKTVGNLE